MIVSKWRMRMDSCTFADIIERQMWEIRRDRRNREADWAMRKLTTLSEMLAIVRLRRDSFIAANIAAALVTFQGFLTMPDGCLWKVAPECQGTISGLIAEIEALQAFLTELGYAVPGVV